MHFPMSHSQNKMQQVLSPKNPFQSSPIMSKYELSRILGIRVAQLSMSATPQINMNPNEEYSLLKIAALEIKEKVLETTIRHNLAHNEYIDVRLKDIDIPPDLDDLLSMLL